MFRLQAERLRRKTWGVRELLRDVAKGVRGETFSRDETSAIETELEDAFDALQRAKRIVVKSKTRRLRRLRTVAEELV